MLHPRSKPETVFIRIEADYDMRFSDLWPDGDAPQNPTAEDIKMLMEEEGTKSRLLSDWALDQDLAIYVSIGWGPEVEVFGPDYGVRRTSS